MAVVRHSDAIEKAVCERCYCRLAPKPTALKAPSYRSPARLKPSPYARLFGRMWDRLRLEGTVFYVEPGRIAGWCPVCGQGTIVVRFIDIDPPRVRLDPCSDGCSEDWIAGALR